jgi:tetratricopeptide (TPR) repeat protein
LLAFDRLHPSIARLPTAEDAALAYAQVATFVARFHRQHGTGGLRAVVERIAQGADARAAFAAHAGTPWATLEAAWVEELRTLPEPTGRAPGVRRLQFRRGQDEDEDEDGDIDVEAVRRALHLGDLLWAHRRPGAAAAEYERAWAEADGDPVIGSRLARASLAAGRAERAIEVLTPLSSLRPDHAPTWSTLSAALQASGSDARALEAAHEALWLNPFDPQPHCVLAAVGATDDERTREQATCRELRTQ